MIGDLYYTIICFFLRNICSTSQPLNVVVGCFPQLNGTDLICFGRTVLQISVHYSSLGSAEILCVV